MDILPFIDKKAIDKIQKIFNSNIRPFDIFEWGSGGSTIWFGMQNIGNVWSVEHSLIWFNMVSKEKNFRGLDNVTLIFSPPVEEMGCVHSPSVPNMNFQPYINSIFHFNIKFDLIFVDGRARVMCFKNAYNCVKPGGYIILHDSGRKMYDECRNLTNLKYTEIIEERSTLVCQFQN